MVGKFFKFPKLFFYVA